jgi:uncharacterized membrane protein YhaH (DUF805 family)
VEPLDWALLPFKRYFDFSGRSSRAEYWYFTVLSLFVTLFILLLQMMSGQLGRPGALSVANSIFGLATFIPSLAVAVRRLHDINQSGFVLLKYIFGFAAILIAIPFAMFIGFFAVGLVVLAAIVLGLKYLMLMVTEGDRGPNLYGPNPYGLTYGY